MLPRSTLESPCAGVLNTDNMSILGDTIGERRALCGNRFIGRFRLGWSCLTVTSQCRYLKC